MSIYIVFTRRPMYTCLFYLNRYKEYTRHTIETTEENESEPRNTINVYRLKLNEKKKQLVNTLYQLNYMYHDFNIGI